MEMTPDETTTEEKSGRSYWGFVIWPVVAVMVYVLSSGPLMLAMHKRLIGPWALCIHRPLKDVIDYTPLDKAYYMYIHFWIPDVMDIHGKPLADF
jgi:hypothetical protein